MTEPFDAVLAEIASGLKDAAEDYRTVIPQFHAQNRRRMKALATTMDDAIAAFDRLAAAHAAEVAVKKSLAKEVWAAIARADAAVGLLRERIYDVETYADEVKWSELARTFLAEQARVGGENGNG